MDFSSGTCRSALILVLVVYFAFVYVSNQYPNCPSTDLFSLFLTREQFFSVATKATRSDKIPPTDLSHLLFGLVGSERAWHHRKAYIESWWRPNATRGFLFLDTKPTTGLLPWSPSSPPYRVSDDLRKLLNKEDVTPQRIIHAVMEVFREDHEGFRWLVMGDDDSIFILDNIVEVLAQYDHRKYYYFGGHSEFILSNYRYSFSQGFGGAGFILSYPLAKALADDMEKCLLRYRHFNAADKTTMACVADIGVSLTALKGIHQIDLRGDISGFLSSHPKFPLMSLHHFDVVESIFPYMNRAESTRHLLKAAALDHSRMLQQTICHDKESNWSVSVSWGYSAHIYERIMPRSYLQCPIETFRTWDWNPKPPHYMFNTRLPTADPCEAPHIFYYDTIEKTDGNQIVTRFTRLRPRGSRACRGHSAEFISRIHVYSPDNKRFQVDRSECCDFLGVVGGVAKVKFRECAVDEIIA